MSLQVRVRTSESHCGGSHSVWSLTLAHLLNSYVLPLCPLWLLPLDYCSSIIAIFGHSTFIYVALKRESQGLVVQDGTPAVLPHKTRNCGLTLSFQTLVPSRGNVSWERQLPTQFLGVPYCTHCWLPSTWLLTVA